MNRYIVFDCETGGFDSKTSPILTAYFGVLNEDFVLTAELELAIKPETPYTEISDGALKANGIDMEEHLKSAISLSEAKERLLQFLQTHSSKKKGERLRPVGQNLAFDFGFIFEQLISKSEWDKWVHYVILDTKIYSDLFKICGILPEEISDLSSMVKHYGIPQLTFHNAKGDSLMTVEVLKNMIQSLKSLAQNSGQPQIDLLSLIEQ